MILIKRYITIFLLIVLCSIWAFSQNEEKPEVIYVPYADTISQELVDYIRSRTKPYILSYHSDMKHLIPEMRCRIQRGKRIGVFSVAKDRQVSFSQGNLQYHRKRYEWKFADNQWDYLVDKNLDGNHIDLFDWTTDSIGGFLDWGAYEIQGDFPNTWRTLTIDEWKYLFHDRPRATELLGGATIEGVMGIVVLPDDWQCPEGLNFISVFQEDYTWDDDLKLYVFHEDIYSHNIFTSATWSLMEQAGAVFLPTSGYINGFGKLISCGSVARMWSSTSHNYSKGYYISFGFANNSRTLRTYSNLNNDLGHSVRLVHDTIVPLPAPCETFEVNGVKFNMMCVEGGTFMMGVGSDAHQVTLSDYKIAQTELTQELWEAVMGKSYDVIFASNYPDLVYKGANYPAYALTWYDCQEFITRLNQLTGLDFRLPTEAEWEYAARGGNRSRGFKYSGSDNLDEVAWYALNSDNHMYPIAQKKPNELGIYDMTGNAWELCLDGYETYSTYPQTNPLTPVKNEVVARGGSSYKGWNEDNCLITHRLNRTPNAVRTRNTLRLVLSDEVKVKTIVLDKKQIFNMVYVEGGTFMMGSNQDIAPANARPAHSVTLSDFFIAQTEVTNELWQTVMSSQVNKKSDSPVGNVTWEECQIFTQQLSQLTGLHFRLPTEAEWEYAARGGQKSRGYLYSGSNEPDYIGWLNNMSTGIQPVAQKMPNELGIYDMTGNSWEWCQDGGLRIYKDAVCNPMYDGVSTGRVIRGGSFRTVPERCINIARSTYGSNKGDSHISMRLVMDAHDYVDLGLSVMWATTNVGATAPEEYGDYFAWGEVEPKETYTWENYKHGTTQNITKYNATDGLTTLLPEDDAAHANWGGEWRMPSFEEQRELREYCTWEWITVNGVIGYQVISKINGNSIFLPAAGNITNQKLDAVGRMGYQWSSTNGKGVTAHRMHFSKSTIEDYRNGGGSRACGVSVRPVIPTDCEPLPPITPAKRIGVFSVAKDKQVSFSQGNLQYIQSADLWCFAENQYDYIGADNVKDGQLADKIDLFGWSGKNNKIPFGVSTSTNNTDYAGEFIDWGTNEISGDVPNTWRTLSADEWEFLIKKRINATMLYGVACINGVNGLIILPDDWTCPNDILFKPGFHDYDGEEFFAAYQTFNAEQWIKMEEQGAIFLPAGGIIPKISYPVSSPNQGAHYQSSSLKDSIYSQWMGFRSKYITFSSSSYVTHRSVRLVHDTIVPPPAPCHTIEVNGVTFNMMCVDGEEYDYFVGQTEVTCSQWKAVMGSLPKGHTVGNKPIHSVTWGECQEFITKLNELTGLYFRFPTKDEWLYAAKGGQYKDNYLYSGSDDINQVGWYSDNSVGTGVHDVAKLKPNSLGIYDMTGNVWEWVESADGKHLYMGGSYAFKAESCLLSKTQGVASNDNHTGSIGIRLVLVINK